MTATAARQTVFTAVFRGAPRAWPRATAFAATVKDLVEETGLSETTVRKALKDLEAGGHVVSEDVNSEAQGSRRRGQFKEIVWQAANISIDDSDEDDLAAYIAARLTDINETPKETTMLINHDDLIKLHTAPSGKTTLWGVSGREETFKSKTDALAFIKANEGKAAPIVDLAEALKVGIAAAAPKAGKKAAPAPALEYAIAEILPEGATTQASPSGSYVRVMVHGKSVGYVTFRKRGTLLAEVLTSRLGEATKADMKGTKARQNQTAVLVNSPATEAQARRLFALAAATVEVTK